MQHNERTAAYGGGPQTEGGKAVTRYNAATHGILRDTLTDYEEGVELGVLDNLRGESTGDSALESLLLERIAIHYVKLRRVAKAEQEFVRSVLNPRKVTRVRTDSLAVFEHGLATYEDTVENEGYTPQMSAEAVERLCGVYARYETSIENRFFRAIRELRELRAAKPAA